MSSPKAAPGATAPDLAGSLAALLSPARAAASRRNGAKSRGPKTPEGKAHSARNALKHGFRAQKFEVVGDENPQEFAALEAALVEELAPEGALQSVLAARIARAAWRLERAERIEAELFAHEMRSPFGDGDLGLALIRDGNGARAFNTLLRYRGATLAELWRALRMLKALQAETHAHDAAPEKPIEPEGRRIPHEIAPKPAVDEAGAVQATAGDSAHPSGRGSTLAPVPRAPQEMPIEPEARGNPRETASVPTTGEAVATAVASALAEEPPAPCEKPIEPEARGNPGEIAPAPAADATRGVHEDLREREATQKCVTHASLMRHSCAAHASPPANIARSEAGAGGRSRRPNDR